MIVYNKLLNTILDLYTDDKKGFGAPEYLQLKSNQV